MMTCTDGGGGGNGATGGDGLVNPAGLIAKSADLDSTAITGAADGIRSMGSTVDTQTDAIKAEWSTKLPGCYEAPEQETVYALMTEPATASEQLKTTFDKMAGYLDTYAAALEAIKPDLSDWETRAQAFRDRVIDGVWVNKNEAKDSNLLDDGVALWNSMWGNEQEKVKVSWKEDTGTVEENQGYIDEIAAIYARVSTAASTCATSINGLTSLPADKQVIPPIPKEAFTNPEAPMPWGYAAQEERNCRESTGEGFYQFGKGTVEGLGSLISYNPETGDWGDWGHAGQAWMGTGNLLMSLAVTSSPVAQLLNGALKVTGNGDSAVSQWIDERNKMTATVGAGLVGIDLNADDPFHKWKEDGVATFTESFLNVGTMFIPGAGQVGAGLKAASIGARVAKITSAVADFAIPGGSFLVKGGIRTIPVLNKLFKFADHLPTNLADDIARDGTKLTFGGPGVLDDVVPDLTPAHTDRPVSQNLFGGADADAPRTTTPHSATPDLDPRGTRPSTEAQPDLEAPAGRPTTQADPEVPAGKADQPGTTGQQPAAPEPAATRPDDVETTTTHEAEAHDPTEASASSPEQHASAQADPGAHPEASTQPEASAHPVPGTEPPTAHSEPGAHPDTTPDAAPGAAATHVEAGTHVDAGAHAGHADPASAGHPPTEAPDGGPVKDRHGREYTFDADGRRHVPGDPDGTYRDRAGKLRDHTGWIDDTNRPGHSDLPFEKAQKGTPEDFTVSDAERAAHDVRVSARDAALDGSHLAHDRLSRLVESTGLSPEVLKGSTDDVVQAVTRQVDEGTITVRQRQSLLRALAHDRVAAQMLKDVSERLGDKAAAAVARMRGETSLIGAGGAGAGRFDQVTLGEHPPTLRFYEAKGGDAGLGARTVDGVRHQQGTSGYLDDVLKSDSRLQDSVRQFIEANPDSPITKALKDGTIKVEYDLVQALPGGRIKVTPFVLDPSAFTLPTFK